MLNRNRAVLAPNQGLNITAECGEWDYCGVPIYHDPPYGNWGVSSNVGTPVDGDQFQGWKAKDGHKQWNSCTSEVPPPDCTHYNHASCTQQVTITGNNVYANMGIQYGVKCRWEINGQSGGGCKDLDGQTITITPSPWVGPTGYNDPVWPPLVEAEIAAALGNSWLDDSQCYDPENECPPCDLICPPCSL